MKIQHFALVGTVALTLAACGQPQVSNVQGTSALQADSAQLQPQIVNGKPSLPGARPYQVALLQDGSLFCGGSLIAPDWVMTAAHCVSDGSTAGLSVRAGSLYHASGGQVRTVSTVKVHPSYDNTGMGNDIALLKLAQPMTLNADVALGVIPTDAVETALDVKGKYAVVSGWGLTTGGGNISNVLMEVSIPITPNPMSCGSDNPPANTICGEAYQGKDSCNGDSGGPLAQTANGKHFVLGIVSYGPSECNGYGVYTRVNAFQSWIQATSGVAAGGGSSTPTPPTVPGVPGVNNYSGTLSSGQSAFKPGSSGINYAAGTITATLAGPSTADFDLYLQKRNSSGTWSVVARQATPASTEKLTYTATAGVYRWQVKSYTGSGTYTLSVTR